MRLVALLFILVVGLALAVIVSLQHQDQPLVEKTITPTAAKGPSIVCVPAFPPNLKTHPFNSKREA